MRAIPREARRVTYSAKIRSLKKELKLNSFQKSVVIGCILGDGYLEQNWSKTNYRLTIQHSIDQREYLFWKYNIFREWTLREPKLILANNSIRFRTISHPELTELWKKFYKDRKKVISENIADYLDPVALAVWFMDDGNIVIRKNKAVGVHLNTQSFSWEENNILADIFLKKYDIFCSIEKNKKRYRLAIWRNESRNKFISIVKPYIVSSMYYKIGLICDSSSPVETSIC